MTISTINGRAAFRERTEAQDKSPINSVAFHYNYRCPVCKQIKARAGRENRGGKLGYRCADCKAKRDAKISEKNTPV